MFRFPAIVSITVLFSRVLFSRPLEEILLTTERQLETFGKLSIP